MKTFEVRPNELRNHIEEICQFTMDHEVTYLTVTDEKPKNKYSPKQRGALHVWCDMVAQVFVDAGFEYATRVKFNGGTVKIDWTGKLVKEDIYKPMLEAMTGKTSTEDQSSIEPSAVALEMMRYFSSAHGCTLPAWPSKR